MKASGVLLKASHLLTYRSLSDSNKGRKVSKAFRLYPVGNRDSQVGLARGMWAEVTVSQF